MCASWMASCVPHGGLGPHPQVERQRLNPSPRAAMSSSPRAAMSSSPREGQPQPQQEARRVYVWALYPFLVCGLYAKCPFYLVLCLQSVLVLIQCCMYPVPRVRQVGVSSVRPPTLLYVRGSQA